ncbi:MAG: TPR end-of-group domain-containing protein [Planctomycetaceae bacterium]
MARPEMTQLERAGLRFQIAVAEEALTLRPRDADLLRFLAHAYTLVGRLEDGLRADRRLTELLPGDPRVRYNLACSLALTGRLAEALETLSEAHGLGFADLELLLQDEDLAALRSEPGFPAVVEKVRRSQGGPAS